MIKNFEKDKLLEKRYLSLIHIFIFYVAIIFD